MISQLDAKMPSVTSYDPGFTERLTRALDGLGLRKHGRGAQLARWSGMTKGGIAACLQNDRPPKQPAFEAIAENIAAEARVNGIKLDPVEVARYILSNKARDPFDPAISDKPKSKEEIHCDGRIMIKLMELADDMGYNLLTDFDQRQLDLAYEKVFNKISSGDDLENSDLQESMRAWVVLAHKHDL